MSQHRYQHMEDNHHDYNGYEPYKDSHYRKRYEDKRLSIRERQDHLKAKNLVVYTNGTDREGVKVVYSRKYCASLEKLFDNIVAAKLRYGRIRVDHLYKWPSGDRVTCLADVEEPGQIVFVCSEKKKTLNTKVNYHKMQHDGSGGGSSSGGGHSSQGTFRSQKQSPTSVRSNRSSVRAGAVRPFTITVISNTNPQSQQSVFVNPSRQFEELLKDITEMLDMDYPPCQALYPVKYPREKVDSNSSFKKVMASKSVDQFYAVGGEGVVQASSPRDTSPSYGYGKQSNRGPKNGMRQQQNGHYNGQQQMSNGYEQNGYDDYQDTSGRYYRRQDDRSRPDGDDEEDMYTPRNGKADRRRRDSPGKPSQIQGNQRRVDDRYERRRDEGNDMRDKGRQSYDNRRDDYDDRRQKYDTDYDDRYNGGRNGRGRDESEERDSSRKDTQRDTRGKYDRNANDTRNRNAQRLDTQRDDRSSNARGQDGSRDRRNGRDDSEERRYGSQRRDTTRDTRDTRGRNNNARDDSRDRNKKAASPDRGYGRSQKDSKRDPRARRDDSENRGRNDRGRGSRDRDDTPDRGQERGRNSRRGSNDSSPGPTRSPSPTDSEMGNRKQDMDKVNKLNRDDSIDM